jgi:two-component system response regulator HydG
MAVSEAPHRPPAAPACRAKVLIVDNNASHAEAVAESLDRVGFSCQVATSGTEGAKMIEDGQYDVIITDLVMSDVDGLGILAKAKQDLPDAEVILITGHASIPSAVAAGRQGAFQYLLKPLDLAQLRAVTQKAAEFIQLRRDKDKAERERDEERRRADERFGFEQVIGKSPQMREVIERVKRIAPTNATVLIHGETGTGKELIAQAIHQNSPRKNRPFVALNCAALSQNILESELFGHVRGAFTDASNDRVGKFEYADGGTLFLDEVGDMPMSTQIKLLRVLENGEITRVGSNEPVRVNVRIISATNQNLEEAIAAGTFRNDLYHRLKVVTVRLAPLRERTQDIRELITHFMNFFAQKHGKAIRGVSPAARRKLLTYDWPGNVRQLRNFVESMVVVDYDGLLDVDDLPEELADRPDNDNLPAPNSLAALVGKPLEELEKLFIAETLRVTGATREEAAKMLGIGERTLYRKLGEYNLAGRESGVGSRDDGAEAAGQDQAKLSTNDEIKMTKE